MKMPALARLCDCLKQVIPLSMATILELQTVYLCIRHRSKNFQSLLSQVALGSAPGRSVAVVSYTERHVLWGSGDGRGIRFEDGERFRDHRAP